MSTPKGYRPASPERIAERIAWAKAVALADGEDGAARAVLLFAAAYADADDQFVINYSDGDDLEIRRRERTIILCNAAIADETGLALAETNGSINRLAAAGLVKVKGNAKTLTFRGRVLAHVMQHKRIAYSQLNALMQPAADKDVRIACRKLAADGCIDITEVGGLPVYVDVRVES